MTGHSLRVVVILTVLMLATFHIEGKNLGMNKNPLPLPNTVGNWTRSESAQIIDSHNIFQYMNGAGELYLGYGFGHLEVYEYKSDHQDMILVEIYFMNTPDDAFGLLSMDWGGEPVALNAEAYKPNKPMVAPPTRALYGGGLLRIQADTIYARVLAYRETPASKEAVLSIGQEISANRNQHSEPELLNILPGMIASDWKLRRDRIGYFRSHLVLNSLYYVSHKNILDLNHSTEAVTAPYEKKAMSGSQPSQRVQVLYIKYPAPVEAQHALSQFHDTYLTEHPKDFDTKVPEHLMNAFEIENGWVGYLLKGDRLTIAFDCPDRESALRFIRFIS